VHGLLRLFVVEDPPRHREITPAWSEARALRDIYSVVRALNVNSTGDCGGFGRVTNLEGVEEIAAALRERHDVERLGWQQTEVVSGEVKKLIAIAETMCGGSF
jgi:hypothetical protein